MKFLKGSILMLVSVFLILGFSACGKHKEETTPQKTNLTIPVLIKLSNIKNLTINNNGAAAIFWYPDDLKTTKTKVVSLLKGATKTTVHLPKEPNVIFHAYIGPVKMHITTNNGDNISIYPASYLAKWKKDQNGNQSYHMKYIANTIAFKENGKVTYYKDAKLYTWLKNKEWQGTFSDQMNSSKTNN